MMRAVPQSEVPVGVSLGGPLAGLLQGGGGHELERALRERAGSLLRELGIPGTPVVAAAEHQGMRAVQVRVHGRLVPYPPGLMKRIWLATSSPELSDACLEDGAEASAFPDGWLQLHLSADPSATSHREHLIAYIAELARAAIALNPACVLGPEQVDWFLTDELHGGSGQFDGWPRDVIGPVLAHLLELGISLARLDEVVEALNLATAHGAVDPTWLEEEVFGRLAANAVELIVHPDHLKRFDLGEVLHRRTSVYDAPVVASGQAVQFHFMEEALYAELGITLPDLMLVPKGTMTPGWMAVRINDLTGPAFPAPEESTCLVHATVEELAARGFKGSPALNPLQNQTHAIIAASDAERAASEGYTTWNPGEFMFFFVAVEVRRLAGRLVTMQYIEYKLAQLGDSHLQLERLARELGGLSIGELTRVVRQLLREGLPVRDLRLVLDRIASARPVPVDPDMDHLSDVRYPLPAARRSGLAWPELVDAVRAGMKLHIAHRLGYGTGTVVTYLLDPRFEASARALAGNGSDYGEGLAEELRDLCWAEVSELPPNVRKPAILTIAGARQWVQAAIEPELPEMPVISYLELSPEVNVMPIARIAPVYDES